MGAGLVTKTNKKSVWGELPLEGKGREAGQAKKAEITLTLDTLLATSFSLMALPRDRTKTSYTI